MAETISNQFVPNTASQLDPWGQPVHSGLACFYLLLLPLSTAPKDIAFGLLVIFTLLRLPKIWRCYTPLVRMPIVWALLVWTMWQGLTIFWSDNPAEGLEQLRAFRVVLTPLLLWPVLEYVIWLIVAALVGVALTNVAQLAQLLGWTVREQDGAYRAGGLIHPIWTGIWCVAAMCWHLTATLRGNGRMRWISLSGLILAGLGLIATGSRGPWLAGAVAVPLTLVVVTLRRPSARRVGVFVLIAGVLTSAAVWLTAGDIVRGRINAAFNQVKAARSEQVYDTSVGLRIALWSWSWDMFTNHPIIGLGAGEFELAESEHPAFLAHTENEPEQAEYLSRGHPHSTYLAILAETGTIGGVFFFAAILHALRNAWNYRDDHLYVDAAMFVLIGWLIGAQFDCYQLNTNGFGLLMLVIAVGIRDPVAQAPRL